MQKKKPNNQFGSKLKKFGGERKVPYLCISQLKQIVMSVLELAFILVVTYVMFKPVRTAVRLFFTPLKNK